MKTKQTDLQPGDIFLLGKNSTFVIGKVSHVTKSGSVKYFFTDPPANNANYYDFETEDLRFDRSTYIPKPGYSGSERYVWLMSRNG